MNIDKFHASHNLLNTILEGSKDAIIVINQKGAITVWSDAAETIFGYRSEEVMGKNLHAVLTPGRYQQKHREAFSHFRATGEGDAIGRTLEFEAIHKDGHEIIVSLSLSSVHTNGEWCAIGIVRDITKQKYLDEALRKSEAQLKEAGKIAKLGYWELDIMRNTLFWSDEIFEIFEHDPENFEATYEAFLDRVHPDDRDAVNKAYLDSLEDKKPYNIEHRLIMGDGSIKYVQEHCKTFYSKDEKPIRSIGTVQDITKYKELENSLSELNRELEEKVKEELERVRFQENVIHQQKRFADMGVMLRAIAHQWRQPLNNMQLIMELINDVSRGKDIKDVDVDQLLDEHYELVQYMSKTIDDFSNYFKNTKRKVFISIAEEILSTANLFSSQLETQGIKLCISCCGYTNDELQYCCDDKCCDKEDRLYCPPGEFRQVITSIFSNALAAANDYKKSGGENAGIKVNIDSTGESYIISIYNTGRHISDDVLPRIFDPYFTTKHESQGTGIGLFLTKNILENSFNGTISAHNVENGVEFVVNIPKTNIFKMVK